MRLVPDMKGAGPTAAALLIECRANGADGLKVCLDIVHHLLTL